MKKRRKGLLGLLLAGVLALTACGSGGTADTVVLKIDNHDITKYEYMVYLYTTTQSFVSAAGEDVWNLDFDGQTAEASSLALTWAVRKALPINSL